MITQVHVARTPDSELSGFFSFENHLLRDLVTHSKHKRRSPPYNLIEENLQYLGIPKLILGFIRNTFQEWCFKGVGGITE